MKILLINPEHPYHSNDPGLNHVLTQIRPRMVSKLPCLALLAVAALTPPEIEVKYLDENYDAIDFDADFDLIGITLLTPQATRAYEIATQFRVRQKTVVLGGTHVTSMPSEAKKFADTIVIGEAEEVWTGLLNDFKNHRLKDSYRGAWGEMSKVPIPRFELLKDYFSAENSLSIIPLEFSRGCPIDCSFCSVTTQSGAKMRLKKPTQVVDEITYAASLFPNEKLFFKFNDPNPFVNRKAASQILEEIIPLNIKWNSYADISVAQHPDLLKTMKQSGCTVVAIGLESLVTETMMEYSQWKSKYVKDYQEEIKIINDHGIAVVANFILGDQDKLNPVLDQILDFVTSVPILCNFTILTPFPGTRVFEEMSKAHQLKAHLNWEDYNNLNVVFNTEWPEEIIYQGMQYLHQEVWNSPLYQKINSQMKQIISQPPLS